MKRLLVYLSVLLTIGACNKTASYQLIKFQGLTMGTYYSISYFDKQGRNLQPRIDSLLKAFNMSLSLWEPNSVISRINNNDPNVESDDLFRTVFVKALDIAEKTEGTFDFSVGPLVNAWGFGYTDRQMLNKAAVDSLLGLIGYKYFHLDGNRVVKKLPGSKIDFNAIAKGYAVDVLSKFIETQGIQYYIVDIGGEVFARNRKPDRTKWKVGIEKPARSADDDRNLKAVIELENQAIATSGNYRRYYEENGTRYSHTIDPATGYPVNHSLLSTSVIASDCMTADAYATAFMVMGLEKAKAYVLAHNELEAFFIYYSLQGEYETWGSPGFMKKIVQQYK